MRGIKLQGAMVNHSVSEKRHGQEMWIANVERKPHQGQEAEISRTEAQPTGCRDLDPSFPGVAAYPRSWGH